jgi:hypothetical protein
LFLQEGGRVQKRIYCLGIIQFRDKTHEWSMAMQGWYDGYKVKKIVLNFSLQGQLKFYPKSPCLVFGLVEGCSGGILYLKVEEYKALPKREWY